MRDTLIEILMQLRAAWRFRWQAMLFAWIVAIIGWAVVFIIPDQYKSTARVYVDTSSLLRPLLKGLTVDTNIGSHLALMNRTLLRRPNLEKVARATDLDITATTIEDKEKLLGSLRKNIKLQRTRRQNLYTISYVNNDPKMARDVVQAFLTIFVESSLGNKREDSDSVQRFLNKKINEYEALLISAENTLTEFKRKHVGTLPGQGGGIFNQMKAVEVDLQAAQLAYQEARSRRNELKKQLNNANKNLTGGSLGLVSPIDARILELQKNLDQLLLRYTEIHPDVIEIKNTILSLEKRKENKGVESKGQKIAQSVLLEQLHLELGKAEADFAASNVRVINYKNRLLKLKEAVKTLPEVETELERLNRDYNINKSNYNALLSRRESAKMSESANASGDVVKFRIIDPPLLPVVPASPNRPLLSAIVLLVAMGIGGGLAFVLSQLNPVVMESMALRKLTGYPVLGNVSRIWTPELLFKRKLEVSVFIIVGFGLFVVFIAVFLLNLYSVDFQWLKDYRGRL